MTILLEKHRQNCMVLIRFPVQYIYGIDRRYSNKKYITRYFTSTVEPQLLSFGSSPMSYYHFFTLADLDSLLWVWK